MHIRKIRLWSQLWSQVGLSVVDHVTRIPGTPYNVRAIRSPLRGRYYSVHPALFSLAWSGLSGALVSVQLVASPSVGQTLCVTVWCGRAHDSSVLHHARDSRIMLLPPALSSPRPCDPRPIVVRSCSSGCRPASCCPPLSSSSATKGVLSAAAAAAATAAAKLPCSSPPPPLGPAAPLTP